MTAQEIGFALRARNEQALSELIELYGNYVMSRALDILKNRQDAEEAQQDVFLKVWNKADKWDPAKGQFSTWFHTVLKRTLIDLYRRQKRAQKHIVNLEDDDFDDDFCVSVADPRQFTDIDEQISDETIAQIETALCYLKHPKHRLAWVLKHFEGYKLDEIARIMNAKVSTVKLWIYRSKKALSEILQDRNSLTLPNVTEFREHQRIVEKALKAIRSPVHRSVFTAIILEGKSYSEIALVLDVNVRTVRDYINKGKRALSELITEFDIYVWCATAKKYPALLEKSEGFSSNIVQ